MKEKIVTSAAFGAAGLLSTAIVKAGWKIATGKPAPKEDDVDESLLLLIVFGALSAVLAAVFQRVAAKSTVRYRSDK